MSRSSPRLHPLAMRPHPVLPALLIAIATLIAPSVSAQRRIAGVVTDSVSGAAIAGASVRIGSLEEETDADGGFTIDLPHAGGDTLLIHRIGYTDERRVIVMTGGDTMRVRLRPDPVMLTALQIVGMQAGPLPRSTICPLGSASAQGIKGFNVVQLLENRFGYRRVACADRQDATSHVYCAMLRGSPEPIRTYVDGRLAAGGLDDLNNYPLSSIYSIDVSEDRRAVSLVSNRYIERQAWEYLRHSGAIP